VYDKGLQIRGDTPADGNCLFWAVSDQLEKMAVRHSYTHTPALKCDFIHKKLWTDIQLIK